MVGISTEKSESDKSSSPESVPTATGTKERKQEETAGTRPADFSEIKSRRNRRRRKKRLKSVQSLRERKTEVQGQDPEKQLERIGIPRSEVETGTESSGQTETARLMYLRMVPFERGFHFFVGLGKYTGTTATSMVDFSAKIHVVPFKSILFHFQRKDFQTWARTTLGDGILADRIDRLDVFDDLRKEIYKIVQARLAELRNESWLVPVSEDPKTIVPLLEKSTHEDLVPFSDTPKLAVLTIKEPDEKAVLTENIIQLSAPESEEPNENKLTIVPMTPDIPSIMDKQDLPPENKLTVPESVPVSSQTSETTDNILFVPETSAPAQVFSSEQEKVSESITMITPEPVYSVSVALSSPTMPKGFLPTPQENTDKLCFEGKKGVFFTPPGLALSQLFEQEIGLSFTKTDFEYVQLNLPKLLVDDFKLAEKVEIQKRNSLIIVVITGSIIHSSCNEATSKTRAYAQVGGLLTSALACILAKSTGKPIIIQTETQLPETQETYIEYLIGDDE